MENTEITPEEMAIIRDMNFVATCTARVVIEDEKGRERATFPLSEKALNFIAAEQNSNVSVEKVSNLDTKKTGDNRPGITFEFIESPDRYTKDLVRRIHEVYETYGKDFRVYIKVKDATWAAFQKGW